ncbi:acid phosphatase protein [Rutstroemia sp. NJR-2017a WRK4]|nr:acid phosphatase protein [Rutstroemia sp. NJR-2017a WRK4]
MLPSPTLSFTIPSIHDGTVLECRVYHPACLIPASLLQATSWRKRVAIVAHPYAPLGGSYDDAVVHLAASIILKQDFVVGTFNFRGVGSSKGHTSWSSQPEQKDYMSFIGFMVYYMHYLTTPYSPPIEELSCEPGVIDLTPVPSQRLPQPIVSSCSDEGQSNGQNDTRPLLLLAGYSYGSLITTCLPPSLFSILVPFQNPTSGTPHADIKARARFLAQQQNEAIQTALSLLRTGNHRRGRSLQLGDGITYYKSRTSSQGVRMGGDEDICRPSHDMHGRRRSFSVDGPERVRRSVEKIRSLVRSPSRGQSFPSTSGVRDRRSDGKQVPALEASAETESETTIGEYMQLAYLLISPLPPGGVINSLATIGSLRPGFLMGRQQRADAENDVKFTVDRTLVVHGTGDPFVNVKTFRRWTEKLSGLCGTRGAGGADSTFRFREIENGEHFWRDPTAAKMLREEIKGFVMGLSG